MHTHTYVYTHTHTHTHTCIHTHMHACMHTHTYVHTKNNQKIIMHLQLTVNVTVKQEEGCFDWGEGYMQKDQSRSCAYEHTTNTIKCKNNSRQHFMQSKLSMQSRTQGNGNKWAGESETNPGYQGKWWRSTSSLHPIWCRLPGSHHHHCALSFQSTDYTALPALDQVKALSLPQFSVPLHALPAFGSAWCAQQSAISVLQVGVSVAGANFAEVKTVSCEVLIVVSSLLWHTHTIKAHSY